MLRLVRASVKYLGQIFISRGVFPSCGCASVIAQLSVVLAKGSFVRYFAILMKQTKTRRALPGGALRVVRGGTGDGKRVSHALVFVVVWSVVRLDSAPHGLGMRLVLIAKIVLVANSHRKR